MQDSSVQAEIITSSCTQRLARNILWAQGLRLSTLLVGAVYFITAISKGTQVGRTATVIESILPVNGQVSQWMVVFIIAIELVLAGMLISGYRLKLASFASLLLGVLFLVWHVLVWMQPGVIDCGCGAPPMVKKLIGDFGAGISLAGGVFVLSGIALFGYFRRNL